MPLPRWGVNNPNCMPLTQPSSIPESPQVAVVNKDNRHDNLITKTTVKNKMSLNLAGFPFIKVSEHHLQSRFISVTFPCDRRLHAEGYPLRDALRGNQVDFSQGQCHFGRPQAATPGRATRRVEEVSAQQN